MIVVEEAVQLIRYFTVKHNNSLILLAIHGTAYEVNAVHDNTSTNIHPRALKNICSHA